jgi:hypothetical protein
MDIGVAYPQNDLLGDPPPFRHLVGQWRMCLSPQPIHLRRSNKRSPNSSNAMDECLRDLPTSALLPATNPVVILSPNGPVALRRT